METRAVAMLIRRVARVTTVIFNTRRWRALIGGFHSRYRVPIINVVRPAYVQLSGVWQGVLHEGHQFLIEHFIDRMSLRQNLERHILDPVLVQVLLVGLQTFEYGLEFERLLGSEGYDEYVDEVVGALDTDHRT